MGFAPQWLALREPADHAARDRILLARAAEAAGPAPVVVDLGCGTGSTVRAFAGRLPAGARWRLVDADAGLLELAAIGLGPAAGLHALDLRELDALPFDEATLVTASALLDLMPEWWVEALAARLAARRLPFYAALSYDGIMAWEPRFPADAEVTVAFNRHQRTDKGLGAALGPLSAARTAEIFRAAGYTVALGASPWVLGPGEALLQRDLVQGIADAAAEAGCAQARSWGVARIAAAATSTCTIGHADLLALPRSPA